MNDNHSKINSNLKKQQKNSFANATAKYVLMIFFFETPTSKLHQIHSEMQFRPTPKSKNRLKFVINTNKIHQL